MAGTSKVFVCTGDGTIRTFKEEAGGLDGKVPVYGEDFTYTGEYEILDDTDALGTWWRIKFKTSGKLIILKNFIGDIFLVGGGGSSGSYSMSGSGRGYSANIGGGGGGGFYQYSGNENARSGNGGSDGGNGTRSSVYDVSGYSTGHSGGTGQGTTTREFGETFGDLYSGGGCGGVYLSAFNASAGSGGAGGGGGINTSGTPNTGGGGGGPSIQNSTATGGSGILIIRKHKD